MLPFTLPLWSLLVLEHCSHTEYKELFFFYCFYIAWLHSIPSELSHKTFRVYACYTSTYRRAGHSTLIDQHTHTHTHTGVHWIYNTEKKRRPFSFTNGCVCTLHNIKCTIFQRARLWTSGAVGTIGVGRLMFHSLRLSVGIFYYVHDVWLCSMCSTPDR